MYYLHRVLFFPLTILSLLFLLNGCGQNDTSKTAESQDIQGPFYEIYLPHWGGNQPLNRIAEHAERLRNLGIKSVIISPLQPVSDLMKLGEIGSPFAIADHGQIQPGYGTEDELSHLVKTLHHFDIEIYMDWFPAVIGRSHPWNEFARSEAADSICFNPIDLPFKDVLALDYQQSELQDKVVDAMDTWVDNFAFDGFRVFHDPLVPEALYQKIKARTGCKLISAWSPLPIDIVSANMNHALIDLLTKSKNNPSLIPEIGQLILDQSKEGQSLIHYVSNYLSDSKSQLAISPTTNAYRTWSTLMNLHNGHYQLAAGAEIPKSSNRNLVQSSEIQFPTKMQDDFYRTQFLERKKNRAYQALPETSTRLISSNSKDILIIEKTNGGHKLVGIFNLSGENLTIQPSEDIFNMNDYQSQRPIYIHKGQDLKLAGYQFLLLTNV